MHSDQSLVEACTKGDRKAQKFLFEKYSKGMLVVAMRYAKSDQEAEDILQDAFIKIFERINTFRGEAGLGAWIKRIVVNTALNSQRSKLYMFPMVDVATMETGPDSDFSLSDFHFKDLLKIIQELPTGCQAIFNLYAIEGYGHKEIAELLGVSEGTSKSQYARAKQLLQERITKENLMSYGKVK